MKQSTRISRIMLPLTQGSLLQCNVRKREKDTLTDSLTILITDDVGKFNSSCFSAILARSLQFYGTPEKSCRGEAGACISVSG